MKRPLGVVLLLCLVCLPCYAIRCMMFNNIAQYIRSAHGIWIVEITRRTTTQRGPMPLCHARILQTMKGGTDERTLSISAVSRELTPGHRYLVFGFNRTPDDAAWLDNGNVSPVPIPVSFSLARLRGKTVKEQISSIMAARCEELERLIRQFQGEKSALENGLAFQKRLDDRQKARRLPPDPRVQSDASTGPRR